MVAMQITAEERELLRRMAVAARVSVTKHGDHDQSSHGNWADGARWKREAGDLAEVPPSYDPPTRGYYNEDVTESDYIYPDVEEREDGSTVIWGKTYAGGALGYVHYKYKDDGKVHVLMVRSNPDFQRRGVGTWLTEAMFAREHIDETDVEATFTGDGAAFWNRRFGTEVRPNTRLAKHGDHDQSSHGNWARGLSGQISREEFAALPGVYDPGDLRGQDLISYRKEWAARFDQLPPDTPVIVFHATTQDSAELLAGQGVVASEKPMTLARMRYESGEYAEYAPGAGVGDGLYVGVDPRNVSGYGNSILAMVVPKSQIVIPPEETYHTSLGLTLLEHNGAMVVGDVPADMVENLYPGRRKLNPSDPWQELSRTSSAAVAAASEVAKHGSHDQSTHGNWARHPYVQGKITITDPAPTDESVYEREGSGRYSVGWIRTPIVKFKLGGKGQELTAWRDGSTNRTITVRQANGRRIAYLSWWDGGTGSEGPEVYKVYVSAPYRRKGLASALWLMAKEFEPDLRHSHALTEDGAAWADVVKHYGPGPHPGTGTPQSVHSSPSSATLDPDAESLENTSLLHDEMRSILYRGDVPEGNKHIDFNRSRLKDRVVRQLAERIGPDPEITAQVDRILASSDESDRRMRRRSFIYGSTDGLAPPVGFDPFDRQANEFIGSYALSRGSSYALTLNGKPVYGREMLDELDRLTDGSLSARYRDSGGRVEAFDVKRSLMDHIVVEADISRTMFNSDIDTYRTVERRADAMMRGWSDDILTTFATAHFKHAYPGRADMDPMDKVRNYINAHVHQWAISASAESRSLAFQMVVDDEFGLESDFDWVNQNDDVLLRTDEILAQEREALSTVARAMYENTQDHLDSLGVGPGESVMLYRGMSWGIATPPEWATDVNALKVDGFGVAAEVEFAGNALSSWTVRPSIARDFSGGGTPVVTFASVPRERIFATTMSGLGALDEYEVVLLQGSSGLNALVTYSGTWPPEIDFQISASDLEHLRSLRASGDEDGLSAWFDERDSAELLVQRPKWRDLFKRSRAIRYRFTQEQEDWLRGRLQKHYGPGPHANGTGQEVHGRAGALSHQLEQPTFSPIVPEERLLDQMREHVDPHASEYDVIGAIYDTWTNMQASKDIRRAALGIIGVDNLPADPHSDTEADWGGEAELNAKEAEVYAEYMMGAIMQGEEFGAIYRSISTTGLEGAEDEFWNGIAVGDRFDAPLMAALSTHPVVGDKDLLDKFGEGETLIKFEDVRGLNSNVQFSSPYWTEDQETEWLSDLAQAFRDDVDTFADEDPGLAESYEGLAEEIDSFLGGSKDRYYLSSLLEGVGVEEFRFAGEKIDEGLNVDEYYAWWEESLGPTEVITGGRFEVVDVSGPDGWYNRTVTVRQTHVFDPYAGGALVRVQP